MSALSDRITSLTPEKRELLLRRLNARSRASARLAPIERADRSPGTFPLSFAQQRYWFLDQLEPGNPAYNIHFPLTIQAAVDRSALERALGEIVRRHESLRTFFDSVDGEPVQRIDTFGPFVLEEISLEDCPESERPARAAERAGTQATAPFDLTRAPLLRAELMRLGPAHHVVALTTHHIVCDRWSLGILVRELLVLYHAFIEGKPSPLPDLDVQYVDFTVWQRDFLLGGPVEQHMDFWKRELAGELPVLALPTDRPRPAIQTFRGATRTRRWSRELKDALTKLGRSENATLFMTVLAAFKVLLYRYTGQRDVIVGSPIASRNRADIEPLIGFFANTLLFRSHITSSESFRALLRRVRLTALEAYSHQELPFERLVEEIRPERNLSQNPLFQVLLTFQNAGLPAKSDFVTKLGVLPVESRTAQFDLSLYIDDTSSDFIATMEFNTDLFDPATIERMLERFEQVLRRAVASPDRPLAELSMLLDVERRTLLDTWNDTTLPGAALLVPRWFEQIAAAMPEKLAVTFEGEELTYGELDRRANGLARELRARGVGPETFVGVCLAPSLDLVVALLAVLKSGGAYLPMDPSFPSERIAFMLEDSGTRLVLTRERDRTALPSGREYEHEAVSVELAIETSLGSGREAEDVSELSLGVDIDAAHLAYLIYTSGSTGRPKGVQVPHGALSNLLLAMRSLTGFAASDTFLSVTTFSFDIAALELFLPLVTGATLVLASREASRDGHALVSRLQDSGATFLQATPASWRLLMEAGLETETPVRALCGGEALPPDLASELLGRGLRTWNLYGPTETTIWSAAKRLSLDDGAVPVTVSLGRPVANTRIYVLDDDLEPVPAAVPGEIYVGGTGVTRGYYRRPDLTAERFVPDPFSSVPGSRLYRTGDLGRFRADGDLEYIGRNDFQVKVRGFRIELGEIEEAMRRVPGVRAAVVLARTEEASDTRLVAYSVYEPEEAPTVTELRNALKHSLPDYMIPSTFGSLDAFPLTPNGKIDRIALAEAEHRGAAATTWKPPLTETEKLVAAIWCDVLKVERVGRLDNFFDLGGHSLLSMKVIARLEDAIGERVNPRELIFQTLEQFAAACDAVLAAKAGSGRAGLMDKLVEGLKRFTPRVS